jgi:hypothetical protein
MQHGCKKNRGSRVANIRTHDPKTKSLEGEVSLEMQPEYSWVKDVATSLGVLQVGLVYKAVVLVELGCLAAHLSKLELLQSTGSLPDWGDVITITSKRYLYI